MKQFLLYMLIFIFYKMLYLGKYVVRAYQSAYLSILSVLKDLMDKKKFLAYTFSVELKILNLNLRKG